MTSKSVSGQESETARPSIVYLADARKAYLNAQGQVDWQVVASRWDYLKTKKLSLANKYFNEYVMQAAGKLAQEGQQRLLDVMMGGLCNEDSGVGVYATRPGDYDAFAFYLEPLIKEYHGIQGDIQQVHNWDIPMGEYVLTALDPVLASVSMRARVARNIEGWSLPPRMSKAERVRFETMMEQVFADFGIEGRYHSLTPDHKNQISPAEADEMRTKHYLFNDMTSDNHLTSAGIAADWPHGRGIWISRDETQMIWLGEEDQLRIISIVHGSDLAVVDASLYDLLRAIENCGITFAEHPVYGALTTCPTNLGTGKRQSILGHFPHLSSFGRNEKNLKEVARQFGLQARGTGGEHSAMDAKGTADISPLARFGVTEAEITHKLYSGLKQLYEMEQSVA